MLGKPRLAAGKSKTPPENIPDYVRFTALCKPSEGVQAQMKAAHCHSTAIMKVSIIDQGTA